MDCEIRANPRIYKIEWIHNVSCIYFFILKYRCLPSKQMANVGIFPCTLIFVIQINVLLVDYLIWTYSTSFEVQNITLVKCKIKVRVWQYHDKLALLGFFVAGTTYYEIIRKTSNRRYHNKRNTRIIFLCRKSFITIFFDWIFRPFDFGLFPSLVIQFCIFLACICYYKYLIIFQLFQEVF